MNETSNAALFVVDDDAADVKIEPTVTESVQAVFVPIVPTLPVVFAIASFAAIVLPEP